MISMERKYKWLYEVLSDYQNDPIIGTEVKKILKKINSPPDFEDKIKNILAEHPEGLRLKDLCSLTGAYPQKIFYHLKKIAKDVDGVWYL